MNLRACLPLAALALATLAGPHVRDVPASALASAADPLARERAMAGSAPEHQPHLADGVARLGDEARIDARGANLSVGVAEVTLGLAAFGREGAMHGVSSPVPEIAGPEVRIARAPGVTEWWRSLPSGLEQGVTLAVRPCGTGELVLEMSVGEGVVAVQAGPDSVVLREPNATTALARYTQLVALDADGVRVPARLAAGPTGIRIAVNDREAR